MTTPLNAVVIGAGAAGMMCAAVAGQRGLRVMLIDHSDKLAEKIRISGGGRCNFTNIDAGPANYLSQNPHFCKSALSRYTAQDFIALVRRHHIPYHEKHKGQLFCDRSAEDIIDMLKAECDVGNVSWRRPCGVQAIDKTGDLFRLQTDQGELLARSLVIATGGLSIPKIGATDFAYRIARQFDIGLIETRPALVPLTFDPLRWQPFVPMAGISLPVQIRVSAGKAGSADAAEKLRTAKRAIKNAVEHFREDLLFTHRGLSGPAILQISSYWQPGAALSLDLLPDVDMADALIEAKSGVKKNLRNLLSQWLPSRLADGWLAGNELDAECRTADLPDKQLQSLGASLNNWTVTPQGSEGYRKAEVTLGGIDTRELSQQSMMCNKVPGLYFIGESVDVTGWLGGYNFHWAWASGVAAGMALAAA